MKKFSNKNLFCLLILLVPIGLGTKFYRGSGTFWVNNSFSDILYVIFWSVLLYIILPKIKIHYNVLLIFLLTSVLEILQLVKTPFLLQLRTTFWGRTLLGTTFVWSDFIYYAIGSIIAYFILYNHIKQNPSPARQKKISKIRDHFN